MSYIKYLSGLIFLFIMYACSGKPYVVEDRAAPGDSSQVKIYIVNHGWHTGIITPAEKFLAKMPQLKSRFPNAVYLEFGWGDQGFYQAEEITTGITLNAILWPTKTVMHVVALTDEVDSYFSNTKTLCISRGQFSSLSDFLTGSFKQDARGNLRSLSKGIYGDSQFYRGSGSYHLFNTCNTWTAKGLKSAGFEISPSLKLTAKSIMEYLDGIENEEFISD